MGMDQTLSLLNRPPQERVEALEKYPHLDTAPPVLIFELILNLAEAHDFGRAESLFHNRFFPREEGGTNVRQVWIEVQLQRVLASAREGRCGDALSLAQHLGAEVPGLTFTRDGLEPILQSARTNYLLGSAYASCGNPEQARAKFEAAAAATAPDQIRWAWLAARKLPGFNPTQWQERLQSSFDQAANRSRNQCLSELVDVHRGFAGSGTGKGAGCRPQISGRSVAARPHAGISLDSSRQVGSYAVITSIFDLRRASQKSAGARVSVINL